jgi:chromosomal replication initiation ATPase DnaA
VSAGSERPGRQLPLDLPHEPAVGREDFVSGDANREAIGLIDRLPEWPERGVLLVGPAGSGKTHLAGIFSATTGAGRVAASSLSHADIEALAVAGAVAVEDLHAGIADEAALFHLLNLAAERGLKLLLTSRAGPSELPLRLPDLASRLRALRQVSLGAPDDELLRRVVAKLFADRQIEVEPGVVGFIAVRMERSLDAARTVVAAIDAAALSGRRAVTKRLAAEVLGAMPGGQGDFWPDEA